MALLIKHHLFFLFFNRLLILVDEQAYEVA